MKELTYKIDKTSRENLPLQLSRILRQRIEAGYYAPGEKIDSVRMIARAFGVSTVSVQTALSQLKDEGVLESRPGSGIFVRSDFQAGNETTDIAFVFPEEMISPNCLSVEDWILNSEIHLGLLRGAEIYGAKINFIHVDENMSGSRLNQRLAEIRKNDAVLFVGSQLSGIRDLLAKERYVFNILSEYDEVPANIFHVSPDNRGAIGRAVCHAVECGCRSAGIISYLGSAPKPKGKDPGPGSRKAFEIQAELFTKLCREAGLRTPELYDWRFHDFGSVGAGLRRLLAENRPDFLLCNYSYLVSELYSACMDSDLKVGKDIKILAKAPGLIFQGMVPSLTYLKPPMFETAVDIVNYACRLTRGTIDPADLNLHKNKYQLIKGKSTGWDAV